MGEEEHKDQKMQRKEKFQELCHLFSQQVKKGCCTFETRLVCFKKK